VGGDKVGGCAGQGSGRLPQQLACCLAAAASGVLPGGRQVHCMHLAGGNPFGDLQFMHFAGAWLCWGQGAHHALHYVMVVGRALCGRVECVRPLLGVGQRCGLLCVVGMVGWGMDSAGMQSKMKWLWNDLVRVFGIAVACR
jgi:hypothetical protein